MDNAAKLKILLFGGSRNTGYYFMQQALEAGLEVTAIMRNPSAFEFKHPNLKIIKGDALQLSSFENEVAGKDAIVSSLGVANVNDHMVACAQGVQNMLIAMQKTGAKRIICVSASALDTNSRMSLFIRIASKILQRVLKNSYSDLRKWKPY